MTDFSPILRNKIHKTSSVFTPEALLRESRRQKGIAAEDVPDVCILDPDGDIVRYLTSSGKAIRLSTWACYHTDLWVFESGGQPYGIIGCAVGAPFATLIAEELFACGCKLLISMTSAGQIQPVDTPPYFIVIDHALRDEGTSYHYLPASDFCCADEALIASARDILASTGLPIHFGATWTTDAPFRETEVAIEAAKEAGVLAVEMEAAALYAFAQAREKPVLCIAHVTNQMGRIDGDFDKGIADGAEDALKVIGCLGAELIKKG